MGTFGKIIILARAMRRWDDAVVAAKAARDKARADGWTLWFTREDTEVDLAHDALIDAMRAVVRITS